MSENEIKQNVALDVDDVMDNDNRTRGSRMQFGARDEHGNRPDSQRIDLSRGRGAYNARATLNTSTNVAARAVQRRETMVGSISAECRKFFDSLDEIFKDQPTTTNIEVLAPRQLSYVRVYATEGAHVLYIAREAIDNPPRGRNGHADTTNMEINKDEVIDRLYTMYPALRDSVEAEVIFVDERHFDRVPQNAFSVMARLTNDAIHASDYTRCHVEVDTEAVRRYFEQHWPSSVMPETHLGLVVYQAPTRDDKEIPILHIAVKVDVRKPNARMNVFLPVLIMTPFAELESPATTMLAALFVQRYLLQNDRWMNCFTERGTVGKTKGTSIGKDICNVIRDPANPQKMLATDGDYKRIINLMSGESPVLLDPTIAIDLISGEWSACGLRQIIGDTKSDKLDEERDDNYLAGSFSDLLGKEVAVSELGDVFGRYQTEYFEWGYYPSQGGPRDSREIDSLYALQNNEVGSFNHLAEYYDAGRPYQFMDAQLALMPSLNLAFAGSRLYLNADMLVFVDDCLYGANVHTLDSSNRSDSYRGRNFDVPRLSDMNTRFGRRPTTMPFRSRRR